VKKDKKGKKEQTKQEQRKNRKREKKKKKKLIKSESKQEEQEITLAKEEQDNYLPIYYSAEGPRLQGNTQNKPTKPKRKKKKKKTFHSSSRSHPFSNLTGSLTTYHREYQQLLPCLPAVALPSSPHHTQAVRACLLLYY
jgi:activator of 2-hydroxyglutaryl-CoA dehydratase